MPIVGEGTRNRNRIRPQSWSSPATDWENFLFSAPKKKRKNYSFRCQNSQGATNLVMWPQWAWRAWEIPIAWWETQRASHSLYGVVEISAIRFPSALRGSKKNRGISMGKVPGSCLKFFGIKTKLKRRSVRKSLRRTCLPGTTYYPGPGFNQENHLQVYFPVSHTPCSFVLRSPTSGSASLAVVKI